MGKLYVVPTPVGNLEDMTFRAIKVLKEVDLILAEDTRTSGILLKHFEIKNAMQSHHKFNEHKTVESVVNRIKAGETVALISDAGTPGISAKIRSTSFRTLIARKVMSSRFPTGVGTTYSFPILFLFYTD